MADRKPLMAGNWKMNLNHLEAIALVQKLAFALNEEDFGAVEVAVLPPFTDLRSVQTLVDGDRYDIVYGAQDVSIHDSGAYTGEVSGPMLAKLGCTYATVGHSERREYHDETDEVVNAKAKAALRNGLVPIVCMGEGLPIRQAGDQVIAYEPVWAIGTGEVATPADAQQVCGAIRSRIAETYGDDAAASVRVLYGGSVKAGNVAGIMAQPDVDGALVGGASLDPDEFVGIVRFRMHPPELVG
jgi:triosephosphate isomerase